MLRPWMIAASVLLMAASPAEAPFNDKKGGLGHDDVIAFVGEEIFTREAPKRGMTSEYDPVTGLETILVSMDTEWQSRYRILDLVSGHHEGDVIDFTAYDHYGHPAYSLERGAVLLFVRDLPSGRVHDKYNYKRVARTASGEWAICGSPYARDAEDGHFPYNVDGTEPPPRAQPAAFDPPLIVDLSERYAEPAKDDGEPVSLRRTPIWQPGPDADNGAIEARYRPPTYERDGVLAQCVRGVPVDMAVRHELRTSFRYYEVQDHCKEQQAHLKLAGGGMLPGESSAEYKVRQQTYNDALKSCSERIYPSGWPYTD